MFSRLFAWINRYERHLSALAMVAGFIVDNIVFERVDLPTTQLVFLGYATTCFFSISILHFIESRAQEGQSRSRFRALLPIATQFALGGFWSGFLIFYGRSAVVAASWPFLLLLVLVFLGNELFHKYHDRLVLSSVLFFFALYSYAIFTLPVYTHTLGMWTFLASGALAVVVFGFFTRFLRFIGRERFLMDVWRIRFGAFVVLVLINVFYFTHILPPLPLALQSGGIYHSVLRTGSTYAASEEKQSWQVSFGKPASIHSVAGESLYAYSAVFAPTKLSTTIVHRWQRYNPTQKSWVTQSTVSFPINGGRDGGYRGYSIKTNPAPGEWRVEVETGDGHLIGRIRFNLEQITAPVEQVQKTLD
ncbi:MAG TPA: DUF2914 domain-containing protein [Candidatus Paceibacterota bacterium]|nr:DUF2914 domain-containing protein [Candidatus Paceibacterota bacterium]